MFDLFPIHDNEKSELGDTVLTGVKNNDLTDQYTIGKSLTRR